MQDRDEAVAAREAAQAVAQASAFDRATGAAGPRARTGPVARGGTPLGVWGPRLAALAVLLVLVVVVWTTVRGVL